MLVLMGGSLQGAACTLLNFFNGNMRKKEGWIFMAAAGGFAAAFVHRRTRKIQEKARGEGRHVPYGTYEAVFKRPLDITMSGIALVLFSPVMGVIAFMVRFKFGFPVLFKQQRPGLDGKVFTIYKFRTMTDEKDGDGKLLPDEQRLTKFGKWLRSTSLDELPELFNILKGDMSIVGPRPLLVEYLPRYSERQRHRHDVRPGLTGLAQVSGRNELSWDEKFKDDMAYIDEISFQKDLKILAMTVDIVIGKKGISSKTSETMEIFTGNGK